MLVANFPLGQLMITANAERHLSRLDVLRGLKRHMNGDWGDLDSDDKAENERALKDGTRLLSAYVSSDGTRFWIITEADRSSTTVLLPEGAP